MPQNTDVFTKQPRKAYLRAPEFVISSNFTAEPIADGLKFWGHFFHQQPKITFAPYNQVLQQLLIPASELRNITQGMGVILLRWQDWCVEDHKILETLERNSQDLLTALENMLSPLLVLVCPPSKAVQNNKEMMDYCDVLNQRLQDLGEKMPSLHVFCPSEIFTTYPVSEIHDPLLEKEAHIPYSQEAFTAFATILYRKYHSLHHKPYKVIVLDCDNTLWDGVCGEVGPLGISISTPYQALQDFMIARHNEGMLLCLNSKNNQEDVDAVFEMNPHMHLNKSHIVAEKINWESKAHNIKSLAAELNLGLDSFIFIDDDRIQCEEVRTQCPQVLTVRLPDDSQVIPEFLAHIWAFGSQSVGMGAERSLYYKENRKRLEFQKSFQPESSRLDMLGFIESLELDICIQELGYEHIARASELSMRTNQFNLTTQRYQENELSHSMATNDQLGWIVKVSDRFGDYGFVGLMLANLMAENLEVTDFMLSCRAMGRGVEHAMVRHLGDFARDNSLPSVTFCFRSTRKNKPALIFLRTTPFLPSLGSESWKGDEICFWRGTADRASSLQFQPLGFSDTSNSTNKSDFDVSNENPLPVNVNHDYYISIASSLIHIDDIYNQVKLFSKNQLNPERQFSHYVSPKTKREAAICRIWQEVTGVDRVGVADDFFRIGGNSIQAIQVSHRMSKILGCEIKVGDLFMHRTPSHLLSHATGKNQLVITKTNGNSTVLSFGQERLWFIEQFEEGTNAYHLPFVLELERKADINALKYALEKVFSRHEILRSTIKRRNNHLGRVIQVVHKERLPIEEVILPNEENFEIAINADINRPFDLEEEFPIRVIFYTVHSDGNHHQDPDRTIILINTHHIAGDRWSSDVFQKELLTYYNAYINKNIEFKLPELEIQYKDYAVWQRSFLSGDILDQQIDYWKNKLSGYQTLALPTDYVRPNHITYNGAHQIFILNRETSEKLRELARRSSTTLHCVLLSSINILMSKYTGQEDIVIGSPIANRHNRQTEGLIGFFVNTQVNRTLLNKSQTYEELIQQVHIDQMMAQLHQDLPFERLLDELEVERDTSRHPIFQVMFEVKSYGDEINSMVEFNEHFKILQRPDTLEIEKFDLSIFIDDDPEKIKGKISYSTSLFKEATIKKMIDHYTSLLDQLVESPQKPYSSFSLLPPEIYNQIIYKWNETERIYSRDKTICQLFEEQVAKTPNEIAVVFNGVHLNFNELHEKSNQLARHIRTEYKNKAKKDLQADNFIALCLDRSLEMMIGILAVMKAGSAYVPIDPAYPAERLEYILKETQAELILTQRHLFKRSRICSSRDKCVFIDLTESIYRLEDTSSLPQYCNATDLAYVIYTSGSTGNPKGVMVEHTSVINLIEDLREKYEVESSENFLLFANYVFDASIEQIFLSLFSGGSLYVIDNHIVNDGYELTKFIIENQITHVHSTPSHLRTIDPEKLNNLKRVVFGAEYLPEELFRKFKRFIPKVINEYGPTEATITSVVSINASVLNKDRIRNIKHYLLDLNMVPVPVGISGELYIAGACLGRGYLNKDKLTELRFIPNPFATEKDNSNGYTRLYKTGDLMRWLPGGNLEYIGRNDDQVKIRGYRIELGEVEHAISQIPGIKQSCVLVRERRTATGSNKFLVGYYVLKDREEEITTRTILMKLSSVLPDYMMPSTLVEMESFPLTINGKLDKQALPEPEFSSSDENYVPPSNETEIALSDIWKGILGVEKVSVTDDFFRIGGDSILSIQVSSRIRQLGFNCQVKDIFSYKTIAKLAKYLSNHKAVEDIQSEQGSLSGAFGLLPIQQWFVERAKDGIIKAPHHWNQSFLVKVPAIDKDELSAVIKKLVDYHDILRVKYQRNGRWKQVYQSNIAVPPLKTLDVRQNSSSQIHNKLTSWQSGFDLDHGPLFQAGYLYGYKDGSARLFFSFHHMIVDGVSWRIIIDDTKDLLTGNNLVAKRSSYRQWVECVKAYPAQYPEEASYWDAQLEAMPTPNFCSDLQEHPSIVSLELNKSLTQVLLQDAPKTYHTEINDLLLTAMAYALKDVNGNDIQNITLEGHGREAVDPSIDHSRTLGWFTTMFPVKLELHSSVKESIRSIKENLRSIPRKGIGFGAIAVSENSSFSQKDLPPIRFNYLGQFEALHGDWQIIGISDKEGGHGIGMNRDPGNTDHDLIEVNGMVTNGKIGFSVSTRLGEKVTKQLSNSLKFHLKAVIRHCKKTLETDGSSFTPSDFKSVGLSQSLLDTLHSKARAAQNEIVQICLASSLQQGFIYNALSQTEDETYRVQLLFDYHHAIDVDHYIKAWEACIAQYPILRTAFNWEEEIIQIIYKDGKLEYEYHDISHFPCQQTKDEQVEKIRKEDRKRSFDLTKPTLLRLHIIKQSEECYTVIRTEHHSISDGWSGPILLRSLHRYYKALVCDTQLSINEDSAYLDAQEFIRINKNSVEAYWLKTLVEVDSTNDISPLLSEPVEISGYKQVEQPASTSFEIKGKAYDKLKSFSHQEGITLNVMVQFIWHKLLQVCSSNLITIVGTTVSGRQLPVEGIEESVGLYINTLPLIVNWDNDNTIRTQLHQIQKQITALNTHSFVDLAKLHKEGERLFHSLIVFENYPRLFGDGEDSLNVHLRRNVDGVDYPLSIKAYEQNGALTIKLRYDSKYLSDNKANYHIETLNHILDQVIKDPTQSHCLVSLLHPKDYNKIVYEWNKTDKDYPSNKTVQQIFEEQVEKTPNNIALVYEGQELTYRQLNEKSNLLARHIRKQYKHKTKKELQPDTWIALCLDRSLELVIGIMAVLKAGGAYVPIDPSYPQDRIDYILKDTQSDLVLSQRDLIKNRKIHLPESKIVYIDLEENLYQEGDKSNLSQRCTATDLAYVIYTSGTTGNPAGVLITHRSICNYNDWILNHKCYADTRIVGCSSSISFDATVNVLLTPLCFGQKVILCSEVVKRNIDLYFDFLQKYKIELIKLTPSYLSLLINYIRDNGPPEYLKCVIVGGEKASKVELEEFTGLIPSINILHHYGPTETTVGVTSFTEFDKNTFLKYETVPLGRVASNNRAYVLDLNKVPVPIGVAGELYIAGAGLAREYLNNKDLTNKRFIFNPFATENDKVKGYTRLYNTGDVVRWLPDGNLEFIGRNDDQVKIRGYRIELGEIEHAMTQVPEIKQSCVLVKQKQIGSNTTKYLVGYYVLNEDENELTKTAILDKLSRVLPDYMVPSSLMKLENIPLNINGKLDKRALPDPEFTSDVVYVAPGTEAEKATCRIWQEVLGLEKVGITDDFFKMGGNSIQAIRVSHQMNKVLGREVKIADIFKYKNPSEILAHCMGQTQLVIPKTQSDPCVLSFAQERLWFIEQYEEGTNAYHLHKVLELKRQTDIDGIKYALLQIVIRHEILRSTITLNENQLGVQSVHHEPLRIEEKSIGHEDNFKAILKAAIDRPFDLKSEYPIRAILYTIRSESARYKTILLINIHHIASDGWSNGILIDELIKFYETYIHKDNSFDLPPLEIQYRDYAAWQRQYLKGRIFDKQLEYWKNKLSGYKSLELPTDYTRPVEKDYKGSHLIFTVSKETSEALRAIARNHGVTMNTLLLSSIHILLCKYTGQEDVVIGVPIANRHHHQTKGLIGFFINTLVSRAMLGRDQSFISLIKQVHQDQIAAQLHQDLPFENLVDELRVERDSSRHPIFQVMFQSFGEQNNLATNNKYFKPYQTSVDQEVEKFDLSINIDNSREEMKGRIGFATSLFHRETIVSFADHYINLLDQLAKSPQTAYSTLHVLGPEEYNRIVYEWNRTDNDYPRDKTIHQLFEEQTEKTNNHIALVYEGQEMTYQQLNEKSNQLARHIRKQYKHKTNKDLLPDTLIALCMDRSPEMVIGIMAVLKAGGAYVPIDPSYPQERLDFILEDTQTELVLSQKQLIKNGDICLPSEKVIPINLPENLFKKEDTSNLPQYSQSTDLAYVIYTSGTTGKPKGVMVEHKSIASKSDFYEHIYGVSSKQVSLFYRSYGFDGSIEEYLIPLLHGAKTIIYGHRILDLSIFIKMIKEYGVTKINVPPQLLYQILESDNSILDDIKILVSGGDKLDFSIINEFDFNCSLFNAYGPTECTNDSHIYRIDKDREVQYVHQSCIGRSVFDCKSYVLDQNLTPVPPGVIGELYIGGAGLARGYLNNAALTAERFIPNQFATRQDMDNGYTRLYKTGDLVRWLPDGDLEFIGRNDDQVKIRGFRIELGEVEHALSLIPGIKQGCVLVRERGTDTVNNKYLVGYYILNSIGAVLTPTDISDKLSTILPEYMVPGFLVEMDVFPLTFNGKLDKRAFPAPDFVSDEAHVAPTTEVEKALCQIWQEVLGLEKVGITDDFFRMGGNSIQAIQVSHRMNKVLKSEVKVADMFRFKTIHRILDMPDQYSDLVKPYQLHQSAELDDLVFIPPGRAGAEMYQHLAEGLASKYNCIGIENYNIHEKKKIYSLNKLAEYYLSEYSEKFTLKEPVNFLGWSLGGLIALEMAAILESRGAQCINVFLLDTFVSNGVDNKLRAKKEDDEYLTQERAALLRKYDAAYVEKVISALLPERDLMASSLSRHLYNTKVVLFKATQRTADSDVNSGGTEKAGAPVKISSANNVDLVADNVEVINLDCTHHNILDIGKDVIRNYLLTDTIAQNYA